MNRLRTTRTYSTTDIVIVKRTTAEPTIYAQDFSHHTNGTYITGGLPPVVGEHIDVKHMRVFSTMRAFTEWLMEVGAIVDKCVCR